MNQSKVSSGICTAICNGLDLYNFFNFGFWDTPSGTQAFYYLSIQGLLMVSLCGHMGTYGMAGIEPMLALCKASGLSTVPGLLYFL